MAVIRVIDPMFRIAIVAIPLFTTASPGWSRNHDAFAGGWAAIVAGYDATELPDKDGPEVMASVEAGYNKVRGKKLVGIEAEFGTSNAHKDYPNFRVAGDEIHVRYGRDIYLGLRGGLLLGRNVLGYAKAGYVNGYVRTRYEGGPPENRIDFARPGALDGFYVGGGVEVNLSRHVLAKSEYRYSNFHDGLYRHQAVVGLGIRF